MRERVLLVLPEELERRHEVMWKRRLRWQRCASAPSGDMRFETNRRSCRCSQCSQLRQMWKSYLPQWRLQTHVMQMWLRILFRLPEADDPGSLPVAVRRSIRRVSCCSTSDGNR